MKKKTLAGIGILFLIVFLLPSGDQTTVPESEQVDDISVAPPVTREVETPTVSESETFEAMIKDEIDDAHLLSDETKTFYNPDNKALVIDLFKESYWDSNNLKTVIYMDTINILKITASHPDEIETVSIEYQAMLLDQNRNDVRERVFLGAFLAENTNQVNWENVYMDEQETFLRQNADTFWVHPVL